MPETVVTRRCCTCNSEKSIEEFHRHYKYPLGRRYECKYCTVQRTAKWYEKNRETILAKNKSPEFKAKRRNWERNHPKKPSPNINIYRSRWHERNKNNPHVIAKLKAKNAISYAIRRDKLIRPKTCEICNLYGKIEAHHYLGYAKEHWLDVQWLCKKCHAFIHRKPLEILGRMPSPLWDLLRKA